MDRRQIFIWTEAFNCGEILEPMLSSYVKHHNYPINVYATDQDFEGLSVMSPLITFETLDSKGGFSSIERKILRGYKKGHKGTAILWEYLINEKIGDIYIHLDSDQIFLGDVITDLVRAIKDEGYAIAGSRRAYKNRSYRLGGRDGVRLNQRPDCVNTDCFAFKINKIRRFPRFWLRRKILGKRISHKPVVDFFDPLTFEIIKKDKKIKYMDSPSEGYSSLINYQSAFMSSRISFAAVGSGCSFFKNGHHNVPEGYWRFALASYSLFAKEFLNKDIGVKPLEDEMLIDKIANLDQSNWVLKEI
jgi:hypothetical protein